jgi:formylglycine-generating enzyme required for sulfatase activity
MKRFYHITFICSLPFLLLSCATSTERAYRGEASEHNMILVDKGWFMMGSEKGAENGRVLHQVYLDSYYIDSNEVTAADFAAFLNSEGNPDSKYYTSNDRSTVEARAGEGPENISYRPREGYEDYPANNVSWYGADVYCHWMGKRLPTEAEWEKAARGTDERTYPWGYDVPDNTRAQYNQDWDDKGLNVMVPVKTFSEGTSFYGAHDMAGNVWEWIGDWYRQNYCDYCDPTGREYVKIASEITGKGEGQADTEMVDAPPRRNPGGPPIGVFKVLRGGSWDDKEGDTIRSTYRYWLDPEKRSADIGFRCASTVLPEVKLAKVEELPEVKVPEVPAVEIAFTSPVIPDFDPVFFDFDKYDIREDAKPVLQIVYDWMMNYTDANMALQGHCDERGSKGYNMKLGEKRARTTKAYLIRMGISPERLDIVTYGEDSPFCFVGNRDCWQSNRRVNFVPVFPTKQSAQ